MKLILENTSSITEIPEIMIDQFPYVIGRGGDSHLKLPLAFISRQHCLFNMGPEGIQVQDLESHNGTYVNGKKANRPLVIHNGDEVSLGSLCFRAVIPCATQDTAEGMNVITIDDADLPVTGEPSETATFRGS